MSNEKTTSAGMEAERAGANLLDRAEVARRVDADTGTSTDADGQGEAFFAFMVGGLSFAVPAAGVHSVEDVAIPSRVPGCPGHVPGVVSHRGRVLPVLDLAQFLGIEGSDDGSEEDHEPRMIVMAAGDLEVSVPCERACGLVDLRKGELGPCNVHQGKTRRFLVGEVKQEEGILGVLDLESLLEAARVA